MEAKCQDCDNQFELNERGPRKRFCGSIQEKTGCVYKRWRASIARSNHNRLTIAPKQREEKKRYHFQSDKHELIERMWRKREGRTSQWVAEETGIPLEEVNWYVEKICRAIDYGN